jgi:glycosyltransferase involved in cell wall biosynthesis
MEGKLILLRTEKKTTVIRKKLLKKAAYFSVNSFVGGAEMATLNYCIYHRKIGKWSPILFVLEEGDLTDKARKENIPVVSLNCRVRMSRPYTIVKAVLKLRHELRRHGVSLIQASMGYAYIIAALASLRTGIVKVWYQHGPVGTIFDRVASFFKSDLTFYNSNYLLKLGQKVPASFDHCEFIVPPIVVEMDYSAPQKEVTNFAHVGRITPFKNIDVIIRNFAKLTEPDIFLNLYGDANSEKDKEYKRELEVLVKELGLSNRVFFHGHISNIESVISKNDCIIHAAKEFEPFGLTIAEMLISGVPLICSSNSGASQSFVNDRDCFKYLKESEMLACMQRFLALSHAERLVIASNGKEKALDAFGASTTILKAESLYDRVV